jgi:transcriptional regulator GlxA family with amidase domain
LALAKAGVLSHSEITPHWEKRDGFRETFSMPNPSEKAYVVDGRACTSAGGATSAEQYLTTLQNDFGPHFATIACEMMNIADARSPDARQTNSRAATL